MLYTGKGQMVQAQNCSELTEISYDTLVRFFCPEMTEPEMCEFVILFKYLLLMACKSDSSGSQLKGCRMGRSDKVYLWYMCHY